MSLFGDPNWLILNNTLISAKLTGHKVRIPSMINGEEVRKIGRMSLVVSPEVKQIEIPDCVESIESAISNSNSAVISVPGHAELLNTLMAASKIDLSRMSIRVRMNQREYDHIIAASKPIGNEKRVLCEGISFTGCLNVLKDMPGILLPDLQMDTLFMKAKNADVFTDIQMISETGNSLGTEDAYICDLIKNHRKGFRFSSEKETVIDTQMMQRRKKDAASDTVCTYGFMDKIIRRGDEWISNVYFRKLEGTFYTTIEPVIVRGNTYYIHFRNYLSINKTEREAFSVYSDEGLITNAKFSEEIYAKYRFVSLL